MVEGRRLFQRHTAVSVGVGRWKRPACWYVSAPWYGPAAFFVGLVVAAGVVLVVAELTPPQMAWAVLVVAVFLAGVFVVTVRPARFQSTPVLGLGRDALVVKRSMLGLRCARPVLGVGRVSVGSRDRVWFVLAGDKQPRQLRVSRRVLLAEPARASRRYSTAAQRQAMKEVLERVGNTEETPTQALEVPEQLRMARMLGLVDRAPFSNRDRWTPSAEAVRDHGLTEAVPVEPVQRAAMAGPG